MKKLFVLVISVMILIGFYNGTLAGNPLSGKDFIEMAFGINMKMVYVEGGTFLMGGTAEQGTDARSDEKPWREVRLDSYYIGAFEVTQSQWVKVMGKKNSPKWSEKDDNLPADQVSWNDIQTFLSKLSQLTGRKYALPTEAQWEYAARGGNKNERTKYSGSNSIDNVANYFRTTSLYGSVWPVGTKHRSNVLGLYDMSGNVEEWCSDWYGPYPNIDQTNPTGPSTGANRVVRGGRCFDSAEFCRVSTRANRTPLYRAVGTGFRVVLIP